MATRAGVIVTVDNSAPPPATIAIDAKVVRHAQGTLTSPALTTAAAGERLLAFVGFDGPAGAAAQSATVTATGLTLDARQAQPTARPATVGDLDRPASGDAQRRDGDARRHCARASTGRSTVIAFRNAAGIGVAGASGAPSGAPGRLPAGRHQGSWAFAVGNDWDRAVARTPVAGQTLQDQWVDTAVGDTFWVQSTTAPNTAPLVMIDDSAPTNDQYNYVAAEVTAAPAG